MKLVDHMISEREVLRYLTNLQQTSKLNKVCPFTMKIFSSFQDEDHLYLELEYVEGCTLLSQIRAMNEAVINNMPFYSSEVLLTLEFLHSHNIIYRDLKPENIVLSMQYLGHIKLVDFGFARQLTSSSQKCHTNCGTPQYIAPEIVRGAGHSKQADIWSFGVLVHEIVSGQTPFEADNSKQLFDNIGRCKPTFNRKINQNLRDLLNRIFVSDPNDRISIQEIKEHPVFKVSQTSFFTN